MTNPQPTPAFLQEFYKTLYRPFYRRVQAPSDKDISKLHIAQRSAYTVGRMAALGVLPTEGSILDLGCGDGSLLRAVGARRAALHREGVEPGSNFRSFANEYAGCTVHGSLDQLEGDAQFDVITMIHVLEHVADPVPYLESLQARLRTGGFLYIDVPDVEKYKSIADLHIAHIFHFSMYTLQALLGRAGYRTTLLERHKPPAHPHSLTCVATPGPPPEGRSDLPAKPLGKETVRKIGAHSSSQLARVYLIDPVISRLGLSRYRKD